MISIDDILAELLTLKEQLEYHNDLFFNQNNSVITDGEYDLLKEKYNDLMSLAESSLEADELDSCRINSASVYNGLAPLIKFTHNRPFASMDRTYDFTSYDQFAKICQESYIEVKLDGMAIELIYQYGVLTHIVTKGNVLEGEIITHNLPLFKHIPKTIDSLKHLPQVDIRAEACLSFDDIDQLKTKGVVFEKQRNQVSGWLRSLVPSPDALGVLNAVAYDVSQEVCNTISLMTGLQVRDWLKKIGFQIPDLITKKQLMDRYRSPTHPFDGYIVKASTIDRRRMMGERGGAPAWMKAFKYNTLFADTIFEEVTWEVYRSNIAPTLHYQEVNLDGSKCTKCTGFFAANVQRWNLGKGDRVRIVMGGDVVPQFHEVLERCESPRIVIPTKCPCCEFPTVMIGASLVCTNEMGCESKIINTVIKAVGRPGLYIKDVGEVLIRSLVGSGQIKSTADLYSLGVDVLGEKKYNSVNKSRKQLLSRFIYSLDIPDIGSTTAVKISREVKTLDGFKEFIKDKERMLKILGEVQTYYVSSAASNPEFLNYLDRFGECFTLTPDVKDSDALIIVLTGTFNKDRSLLAEQLMPFGLEVVRKVTKDTNCVVVGTLPNGDSSSVKDAKRLNKPIVYVNVQESTQQLIERIKMACGA